MAIVEEQDVSLEGEVVAWAVGCAIVGRTEAPREISATACPRQQGGIARDTRACTVATQRN